MIGYKNMQKFVQNVIYPHILSIRDVFISTLTDHANVRSTTEISGHVVLSNSVDSNAEDMAVTPAALKKVWDRANALPIAHAQQHSSSGIDPISPSSINALHVNGVAVDSNKWSGASKIVSSSSPSGGNNGDIWFQW